MERNCTTCSYVLATTGSYFRPGYFRLGMEVSNRQGFAARLAELCDEKNLPKRGRLKLLAAEFKVSYQAVKKWLEGTSFPSTETIIDIANWAHVNVNWLLQGVGPKRGEMVDSSMLAVIEGIQEMPPDDRQQVLDFLGFKFERADGWFASEKLARYMVLLDTLKKAPKPNPDNKT